MNITMLASEDNMHRLYEASMRGCVSSLQTLILNDPLILHKISLASFTQTPLHISSMLGHLDFTKLLLTQKPELAVELDSLKRSPLHLACAEGHREIVIELLNVNKDVCLVADQDGRIPLHLAAMRGRVEVIKELVSAKPDSVFVLLHGNTVLHLCVKFNHLEALKILMESMDDEEFINLKNHQGYTILQSASMLKQLQSTSYLLSVPQIRVDVNSMMEIFYASRNIQSTSQEAAVASESSSQNEIVQRAGYQSSILWTILNKFLNQQSDLYEKLSGNLMVVATVIAAMTFQVSTNPPGGFLQNGISVLASSSSNKASYNNFLISSTISFAASLTIILFIVSGISQRKKYSVGIMMILLLIAVIYMAVTYILSVSLVQVPNDPTFQQIYFHFTSYLFGLVSNLAGVFALEVICSWLEKKYFNLLPIGNQPSANI